MNKQVWKYELPDLFHEDAVIYPPAGAEVVKVRYEGLRLTVWMLVDPAQPQEWRAFQMFGTGWPVPRGYAHVDTVFEGEFVWHLFENTQHNQ